MASSWPGEKATTAGSLLQPHPALFTSTPLRLLPPDTLCTQLRDYLLEWTQGFRGLSECSAGSPSPGVTNTGESLCIGHLQGLGQCLRERDEGYFNSFGWKLSVPENTLCLCIGPMVGAQSGFLAWKERHAPTHSCWGPCVTEIAVRSAENTLPGSASG